MRREHYIQSVVPIIPNPKYWFPLTSNSNDVMGNFSGWSQESGITYSANGGYFNGSSKLIKNSWNIPNSSIATFSIEFMLPQLYNSGLYTIARTIYTNTSTAINVYYTPSWSNDVNNSIYLNGSAANMSIISIPLVANRYYNFTFRQNIANGTSDNFIDGVKLMSGNIAIPTNTIATQLNVGCNTTNSDRGFKGYIRNFKCWDVELTDGQIAALRREHQSQQVIPPSPLPPGYTQLEYIQCTGAQYINTGIRFSPTMEWYAELEWNDLYSNNAYGFEDWQSSTNIIRCYCNTSTFGIVYGDTSNWLAGTAALNLNTKRLILVQNGHQYVDGVEIAQGVMTKTSTRGGFYYFADCGNGQVQYQCKKSKHYYSYFKDNGIKIREFLPALRILDSKPGLYDIVNDVFYTNNGSGEFLYG